MKTPKIVELIKVARDCPYNDGVVRDGKPTRDLIRDFNVLIDGEHRLSLKRQYTGVGYYACDPEGRNLKDPRKEQNWRNTAEVKSQAEFIPFIEMLLQADAVPTLADIERAGVIDEAVRDNKRFDAHLQNVKQARNARADDLYKLVKDVADRLPVAPARARALVDEIDAQAIAWDEQDRELLMAISKRVVQALNATGLQWTTKYGGHHIKIILDGRMVGIHPIGRPCNAGGDRAELNLIAQIKRAARTADRNPRRAP